MLVKVQLFLLPRTLNYNSILLAFTTTKDVMLKQQISVKEQLLFFLRKTLFTLESVSFTVLKDVTKRQSPLTNRQSDSTLNLLLLTTVLARFI